MSQNSYEKAVQRLLDIEALKQLKYRYCAYCDDDYNPEGIASLFTENAIWDGGSIGLIKGRQSIHEFFAGSSSRVSFAIHSVSNPIIDLREDRAECQWYLWQPMVFSTTEPPSGYWLSVKYRDLCIKLDGQWYFDHVTATTRMFSPYEKGFAKVLVGEYPG